MFCIAIMYVGTVFSSSSLSFSGVDFDFDSALGVSLLLDLDYCFGSRGEGALRRYDISLIAPYERWDSSTAHY